MFTENSELEMRRLTITLIGILLAILVVSESFAQTEMTLEEAIQIALDNNIDLKRAQNNMHIANANARQSKFEFLPSINGLYNYNWISGFSGVDPTTGNPVNNSQRSQPSVMASFNIFNGFQNVNTLTRNRFLKEAAELNLQNAEDIARITATGLFLQVLVAQENIKISQDRLDLLNEQLEREEKRVEVGVSTQEQVFNFKSQIATENLNLVNLQNNYDRFKLQLLLALQLDPADDYELVQFEITELEITAENEPFMQLKETAFAYSPLLQSAELNRKAATKDFQIAKAGFYPTVTFFGQIASFYSSVTTRDYFSQLDVNLQKAIGVSVNIPIFNRFRIMNNVQVSKINIRNSELNYEQAELTLFNNLQQAHQDLKAAQSTYNASQENLIALTQSFEFANKRYQTGNTDFFTFLESLNNKNRAEIELVNSKFSILFRKRILDIYRGINYYL